MLIVSQNKMRTTENMEIRIEELWENTECKRKLFYIKNPSGTLGEYKTEKRAKEILIEIAREFKRVLRTENRGTGQQRFYDVPKVYYMPEE